MILKPTNLMVQDIGMKPLKPLPLYIGMFGHKLPDVHEFQIIDLGTFSEYMLGK